MKRRTISLAIVAGVLGGLHLLFWKLFQPWQRSWGATPEESDGPLTGDEFVPAPAAQVTRAITVNAPPECVWPWLAQMGYRRGGLYSWDFLDRLFRILDAPSAKRVLPEFQDIRAGDAIPVGVGPAFPVLLAEPNRALVLGSADESVEVSWQTVLLPLGGGRTRLITRNRLGPPPPGIAGRVMFALLHVAAFIMVKRWLEVLKERGEGLASGKYT
jgi:hypothetical protein